MNDMHFYNKYSDYLKEKYKEKVYKIPINLPLTCPNRINHTGCTFCSELGTGFEAMPSSSSVSEQMRCTKELIQKKYKARKFIAYFQNYTNTFIPLKQFQTYLETAAKDEDVVEISVSTRPDCINKDYLDAMLEIANTYNVHITVELGLQTANYHTLDLIERGHGLAEFLDAVMQIKKYPFSICTHVILNLPNDDIRDIMETAKILSVMKVDIVKIHSLYIAKNTRMAEQYLNHAFEICSKEEYFYRVRTFLELLEPTIVVERLFSRIPEENAIFCNWQTSWWKLQDELLQYLKLSDSFQGKQYHYTNGSALKLL